MAYNPQTATPKEKWAFRMGELCEYLAAIPFTTNQRRLIEHHLHELECLYEYLRIDLEAEQERKGPESEVSQ